jgi:hypothetical protein
MHYFISFKFSYLSISFPERYYYTILTIGILQSDRVIFRLSVESLEINKRILLICLSLELSLKLSKNDKRGKFFAKV